jgi:two-component system alkaline phosphatase synthesis response regulator PhoP
MAKEKVLVIDDEEKILNLVSSYLKNEGYSVSVARDGIAGLQAARSINPDLIILDIMLPGMDGLELLANLRRESNVYVIMLTAKTEETDKIIGLTVGADDYITKPFSPRELSARVKAALRRMNLTDQPYEQNVLKFKNIQIDKGCRMVMLNGREIDMTAMEFDLLAAMAEHKGLVFSREQLLEKVWGHDYYGELRVIDVHVGHIRQKLGDDRYITTVRGIGYRFEDEQE